MEIRDAYQYIYRMQNLQGQGPYRPDVMTRMPLNILDGHTGDIGHPVPRWDLGRCPEPYEICGFVSLAQANRWFPRNLRIELSKYGFRLVRIPVFQVTAVSKYQCLAIRKDYYENSENSLSKGA